MSELFCPGTARRRIKERGRGESGDGWKPLLIPRST